MVHCFYLNIHSANDSFTFQPKPAPPPQAAPQPTPQPAVASDPPTVAATSQGAEKEFLTPMPTVSAPTPATQSVPPCESPVPDPENTTLVSAEAAVALDSNTTPDSAPATATAENVASAQASAPEAVQIPSATGDCPAPAAQPEEKPREEPVNQRSATASVHSAASRLE